ncbi:MULTISPECIES: ABC transporter substrate-binding protein [unclassified Enterococcus]|jgi:lactose/L-arabinose transport system substrate-binding protein|uniref:ABC transporter substrate-binding protein n=1 Tax=unclassified Enterococcus TaxID=2608891 RepID=UPI003D28C45E
MKKFLFPLFSLLAAGLLAGCGTGNTTQENAQNEEHIIVWAWDEAFNIRAMHEAADYYQNEEVEIEIVAMSQDDIVQRLNTSLASGNTDGLPNIVLVEDYRIQGYLTSYPGAFADLSSIVSEDDFSSYKFAVNKIDDTIYGVPFDSGVAGLFYRLDYLEGAGYQAADLENITWKEYLDIAKTVKEKTGHAFLALDPSDLGLARIMMQSAGSWYTAADGTTVTIENNPALRSSLSLIADFFNAGIVEQISDWDSGVNAVQSGSVATSPTGAWYSSTIQGAEDQSGKWRIAPIPVLDDNNESIHASSIGGSGWYVLEDVTGKENAIDFLGATFASSKELMAHLAEEIGLVSTMNAALETDVYAEGSEFYGDEPVFENFARWSSEVPAVNYGNHTYAIESVMTETLQAIINGGDIDELLAAAQTQVEAQIAN